MAGFLQSAGQEPTETDLFQLCFFFSLFPCAVSPRVQGPAQEKPIHKCHHLYKMYYLQEALFPENVGI